MGDKMTQNKADLLKMLAEAVLNTPGASRVEPFVDVEPELKRKSESAPKRVAKITRTRATSVRKKRRG